MIRTIFICLAWLVGVAAYADTVNYTYDDAGRLTSATYSSGASIQYSYDAAGNMTAVAVTPAPNANAQKQKKPQAVRPKRSPSAPQSR